jgi:hypothetical protein
MASLKDDIMSLVPKEKNREFSQSEVKSLLLDVWDLVKAVTGEVKYKQLPLDLRCDDCGKELAWGTWAYFQAEMNRAICPGCGVKRGWSDKDRAKNLVAKRELQEDIKALRKRQKFEADSLQRLQQEIDLHSFGKRYMVLDQRLHETIDTVQSFIAKVATAEEKQALMQVFRVVAETQQLQKVIQEEVENRLFLLERSKNRKKFVPKVIDDDADPSAEEVAAE